MTAKNAGNRYNFPITSAAKADGLMAPRWGAVVASYGFAAETKDMDPLSRNAFWDIFFEAVEGWLGLYCDEPKGGEWLDKKH